MATKHPAPTLLSLNDTLTQLSYNIHRSSNESDDQDRLKPSKRRRNMAELASMVLIPPVRRKQRLDSEQWLHDDESRETSGPSDSIDPSSKNTANTSSDAIEDKNSSQKVRETYTTLHPSTRSFLQLVNGQRDRVRQDIDDIELKRQIIYKQQAELWGVYKHGLTVITNLTDLRDAPDAIMPGNFTLHPSTHS